MHNGPKKTSEVFRVRCEENLASQFRSLMSKPLTHISVNKWEKIDVLHNFYMLLSLLASAVYYTMATQLVGGHPNGAFCRCIK